MQILTEKHEAEEIFQQFLTILTHLKRAEGHVDVRVEELLMTFLMCKLMVYFSL